MICLHPRHIPVAIGIQKRPTGPLCTQPAPRERPTAPPPPFKMHPCCDHFPASKMLRPSDYLHPKERPTGCSRTKPASRERPTGPLVALKCVLAIISPAPKRCAPATTCTRNSDRRVIHAPNLLPESGRLAFSSL
jgi:hypothetical protein